MNFMGMGLMELGVIFVVAFLVLGPVRSIEMAKTAGKLMRDLRRSFDEMTTAIDLEPKSAKDGRLAPPAADAEEDHSARDR